MHKTIFKPGKKYTFSDYCYLKYSTEEIIAEFGYSFALQIINFSQLITKVNTESIQILQASYYKTLPHINLTSEIAKREFLIAPLLLEIVKAIEAKIQIGYPLNINDKLSGSLDYLIQSQQQLLVIEAKRGDLDGGFNQLAAELIALDMFLDTPNKLLHGAITMGNIWQFGILDREHKSLIKDIHSYRIPEDTQQVFNILINILLNSTT